MTLEEFHKQLKLNQNSQNTVKVYYKRIKGLFDFGGEISQESVDKYYINMIDRGISNSTLNQFRYALKKYCEFSGMDIKIPKWRKVHKKKKNYLKEEQFYDHLMTSVPFMFTKNVGWIQMILELYFYGGFRARELEKIDRKDVDFKDCTIVIRNTKGKEDRIVPIPKKIMKKVANYFDTEPPENGAFNLTQGRRNGIFKKINDEMDFDFFINPTLLRRSCARNLLRRGLDVLHVQRILGHKNIETTMIYAEPYDDEVQEAYRRVIG